MTEFLIFVIGTACGAAVVLLVTRSVWTRLRSVETELASATATLQAERAAADEKLRLLGEARASLSDAFGSLAADQLRKNNEQFLQLAQSTLARFQESAQNDLLGRQRAIGEMVVPIRDSLSAVDSKLQQLEKARGEAYVALQEQVRSLSESQRMLQGETANLVKALRAPATRGRWGEIQLRRVVEMAGMVEYCDFCEQLTLTGTDSRLRPDLIIRLPNSRHIVVDSKTPLSAYLDAVEAVDESARNAGFRAHAAQVRTHLSQLAAKSYWAALPNTPDFVVAFLPGEAFFSAALQHDPELIEYGIENRVLIATPTTLIGLLKAVAYGWRQESMAENAMEISRLGRELYERLGNLADHFAKVGLHLQRTTEAYNSAVGTLESRVLVSARRMKDKGVVAAQELEAPAPVDVRARGIRAGELGVENLTH